jgi:hypothetical protein
MLYIYIYIAVLCLTCPESHVWLVGVKVVIKNNNKIKLNKIKPTTESTSAVWCQPLHQKFVHTHTDIFYSEVLFFLYTLSIT